MKENAVDTLAQVADAILQKVNIDISNSYTTFTEKWDLEITVGKYQNRITVKKGPLKWKEMRAVISATLDNAEAALLKS